MDEFTAEPGERGALTVSGSSARTDSAETPPARLCLLQARLDVLVDGLPPAMLRPGTRGSRELQTVSPRAPGIPDGHEETGTEPSATKESQAKGTHEALPIGQIITDARTQVRAAIDEAIVEEYAEHLRAGGSLPPVTAFRDEASRTYLADGFHRVRAHERAGRTEIDAEIQSGTQEDALWCALGANRAHGHRLTSADKKHAIELALKAWPDRSQTRIAQQIGCSQQYVGKIRGQVTTSCNLPDRTVGEDGKSYPAGRNTPEPTALEDDREDGDGTRPSEMPASAEPKAPGKGERRGTPSRRAQNRSNRIVSRGGLGCPEPHRATGVDRLPRPRPRRAPGMDPRTRRRSTKTRRAHPAAERRGE